MQATASKFKPMIQAKGIEPKRPGDEILVTIPNYWARGKTFAEARQKLAEAGGRLKGTPWRIHSVHSSTVVDGGGNIEHPTGHSPIMLAECDPD